MKNLGNLIIGVVFFSLVISLGIYLLYCFIVCFLLRITYFLVFIIGSLIIIGGIFGIVFVVNSSRVPDKDSIYEEIFEEGHKILSEKKGEFNNNTEN